MILNVRIITVVPQGNLISPALGRRPCMSVEPFWKAVRSQVVRMLMFFDLQIPLLEFRTEEIIRNSENAQKYSRRNYLE